MKYITILFWLLGGADGVYAAPTLKPTHSCTFGAFGGVKYRVQGDYRARITWSAYPNRVLIFKNNFAQIEGTLQSGVSFDQKCTQGFPGCSDGFSPIPVNSAPYGIDNQHFSYLFTPAEVAKSDFAWTYVTVHLLEGAGTAPLEVSKPDQMGFRVKKVGPKPTDLEVKVVLWNPGILHPCNPTTHLPDNGGVDEFSCEIVVSPEQLRCTKIKSSKK